MKERTLYSPFLKKSRAFIGHRDFDDFWKQRSLDKGYLDYFIASYADEQMGMHARDIKSVTYFKIPGELGIGYIRHQSHFSQKNGSGNCVLSAITHITKWKKPLRTGQVIYDQAEKFARLMLFSRRTGLGRLRSRLLYRLMLGQPTTTVSFNKGYWRSRGRHVRKAEAIDDLYVMAKQAGMLLLVDDGHPAYNGHALAVKAMTTIYVLVTFNDGSQTYTQALNLFTCSDGDNHNEAIYLPMMWLKRFTLIGIDPYKPKRKEPTNETRNP